MDYEKHGETVKIKLYRDFNYPNVKRIEKVLEDIDEGDLNTIFIDLTKSKIIDSEAVKFLFKLKKRGFNIILKNVPEIYYEVLEILELKDYFKDIKITYG